MGRWCRGRSMYPDTSTLPWAGGGAMPDTLRPSRECAGTPGSWLAVPGRGGGWRISACRGARRRVARRAGSTPARQRDNRPGPPAGAGPPSGRCELICDREARGRRRTPLRTRPPAGWHALRGRFFQGRGGWMRRAPWRMGTKKRVRFRRLQAGGLSNPEYGIPAPRALSASHIPGFPHPCLGSQ